jgi:DNA primase
MAGVISPELKERIRDANDIVDVVGGYIPLKRAGANFMALCPFHREKTPSFNVNPSKQIFHCFGCHKGGDVFSFVQEYEHLNFPEAAKRLADRAQIVLEWESSPEDRQRGEKRELLFKVHEEIAARWHRLLLREAAGEPGRAYLKERGLRDEAVEMFQIGFAPDEWSDTLTWAKNKGYGQELLKEAGLITSKEGSDHYYDRFRKRLMFPIHDAQGRVIAFSGRVIEATEKGGKYVNSPETPIFKKSHVLFGLDKARQAAVESQSMIVCEGQLDTIACHVSGIKNVVAPQGTALTSDHARRLKRYVSEVVLCFDSDSAGQKAVERSFNDLVLAGHSVRVAAIPAPHDPDSFIKEKGPEAFRELTDKGQGYFDYLLDRLSRSNDLRADTGRRAIVAGMGEAVRMTGDAVLIDTYAQRTSQRLGVSVDSVRTEFSKTKAAVFEPEPEYEESEIIIELPRPSNLEFWLLRLILGDCDEGLLEWLFDHLDLSWVDHGIVREALDFRFARITEHTPFSVADLIGELGHSEAASLITEAAAQERSIPNPKAQLEDIVRRLRNLYLDGELRTLAREQVDSEADPLTQAARVLELQRLKRQPLEKLSDA